MHNNESLKKAEEMGLISDSLSVRKKLMEQVNDESTLREIQKKLKKIQSDGRHKGLLTRDEFLKSYKTIEQLKEDFIKASHQNLDKIIPPKNQGKTKQKI